MGLDELLEVVTLRRGEGRVVVDRLQELLGFADRDRPQAEGHLKDLLDIVRPADARDQVSSRPRHPLTRVLGVDGRLHHLAVETDDEQETLHVEEELHGFEGLERRFRQAAVEVVHEHDDAAP